MKFQINNFQLQFYKKNGFLHLENVLDMNTVDAMRKDAEAHANGFYTNYLDLHHVGSFKDTHTGPILCSIADQILEERAIPIGSIFFFCKPGNALEHGSTWHQDNYAGKAKFGAYLNLAVPLDDADEENGSLLVIPGSHLLGDLPCEPKANFSKDDSGRLYCSAPIGNNCAVPEGLPQVQLRYRAGDILVLHAHTVHKADRNQSPDRWRRKMYFVYIKDNESFWPGWTARRSLLNRFDSDIFKMSVPNLAKN